MYQVCAVVRTSRQEGFSAKCDRNLAVDFEDNANVNLDDKASDYIVKIMLAIIL